MLDVRVSTLEYCGMPTWELDALTQFAYKTKKKSRREKEGEEIERIKVK